MNIFEVVAVFSAIEEYAPIILIAFNLNLKVDTVCICFLFTLNIGTFSTLKKKNIVLYIIFSLCIVFSKKVWLWALRCTQ